MNKSELRNKYKEKRKALPATVVDELSMELANRAIKAPVWSHTRYHIFLPIARQREIDTSYLLTVLQGKDKDVVISRSDFNSGTMRHFLLTDSTVIKVNNFGIPEPESGLQVQSEDLDVIFIPLLAYDQKGNRVGYGKGFYDRFLSACRPEVMKVGLSFFPPEVHISDVSEDDIPLDMCITPEKIYDFRP